MGVSESVRTKEPLRIEIPIDLIPEGCEDCVNKLNSILDYLFVEFSKISGKGYKASGERIERQADISLAGHTLTVVMLYLALLKAYEKEGVKVDPQIFFYSVIAAFFHDLNKYLGKGTYGDISLKDLVEKIKIHTSKAGISLSDDDVLNVICLLERVEKGSAGRYCRSMPESLRRGRDFTLISAELIRLADALASTSSSIPVSDYEIFGRLRDGLEKIDSKLGKKVGEKVKMRIITNSIYNLAKYLVLISIAKAVDEKGGTLLLISRNSVIYLGEEVTEGEILRSALRTLSQNSKPIRSGKRPNQSNLDFPSLAFHLSGAEEDQIQEVLEEFLSREEIKEQVGNFFERYIWYRGDEIPPSEILESMEALDEPWIGYLILYSVCNLEMRKSSFFKNVFNAKLSLPNTAEPKDRSILEKYKSIYESVFTKLQDIRWLEENREKIISEFVSCLMSPLKESISAIKELIKHHITPLSSGRAHAGKGEICALCGRPANREYRHVDPIPISRLVSNFYPNILKAGETGGLRLCDLCFGEITLRRLLLGEDNARPLYMHVSPSSYFTTVQVIGPPEPTMFSIGKGREISIQIEGRLINPVFALDGGKGGALAYFMIAEGPKKQETLQDSFKLASRAIEWARRGFRVEVSKALSPRTEEKAYVTFESLPGPLASYLGGNKFYFDQLENLGQRIKLIKDLQKLSGRRVEELVSSLSSNEVSAFHFLVMPLPRRKRGGVDVLGVGRLAERVAGASYGEVLPILEELADIFVEEFQGRIDIKSRNQRTWPIREAFDAYLRFCRLSEDEVRDVVASQILKRSGAAVNEASFKFAENFAEKFMKLIDKLKETVGVKMIDPSLRTYLIDAFDYYVAREILSGGS